MIEGQEGVTWPQWAALARACEQHDISALMRSDHYQQIDSARPGQGALDAWATLSALAAITTKLRLGTIVSPATFRHPSVLAKLVTTVDHVSGGRVELGIGAGWYEPEHLSYGFPFPPTRTRMDVLEEQLQILLGSWAQGPYSFDGTHFQLRNLDALPKPVQRPHPPVVVGGKAGPRSASLAARFADEYNTAEPTIEQAIGRKARIAEACERLGREPIPFSVMTGVVLGADVDDLRDRARRIGSVLGRDGDRLVQEPPNGWIVGTLDHAREQLELLRNADVSRVMCQHLLHEDLDAVELLGTLAASLR
jgi:F420-dependent oxidoreductase-like protein